MPVISGQLGSVEAPQSYGQTSRKGKKAWRKNVDVSEVERGLDERNKEIISGGIIKEKPSSDLFTIDLVGDSSNRRHLPKSAHGPLKADEIINRRSAVPSLSQRKRPAGVGDGILPAKRARHDWVSHKELARLRQVADGRRDLSVAGIGLVDDEAQYDVWAVEAEDQSKKNPTAAGIKGLDDDDFMPTPPPRAKVPSSMRRAPVSLLASGKAVPAVRKPTGSFSYNPSFGEYEARLAAEGSKAVAAEEKRLAELDARQAALDAAALSAAEADAAEARAELSEWDDDSAWEGFESGAEDAKAGDASAVAKRPQRKTQAQRNRIKRRKAEEARMRHEAYLKAKRAQVSRVRQIAEEVSRREAEWEALVLAREVAADADDESGEEMHEGGDEMLQRRQLGRLKLPERELELVLPDELQDSLRLLKPEGNLLKDRYRSLLMRGRIESRRHLPFKKKAKTKTTEKWAYKDFTLL